MALNRKSIKKSTRFEVFKRDRFKCVYCGSASPDVILQIDHIEPVSKGGTNDIFNLVTSCRSCNLGKSDKSLDDRHTIKKQRAEIESRSERLEQLKMLADWKSETEKIEIEIHKIIVNTLHKKIYPYKVTYKFETKLKQLTKKFGAEHVLKTIKTTNNILLFDSEGALKQCSVEKFLKQLGGILYNSSLNPYRQRMLHIHNILKKYCGINDLELINDMTFKAFAHVSEREYLEHLDSIILEIQAYNVVNNSFNLKTYKDLLEFLAGEKI